MAQIARDVSGERTAYTDITGRSGSVRSAERTFRRGDGPRRPYRVAGMSPADVLQVDVAMRGHLSLRGNVAETDDSPSVVLHEMRLAPECVISIRPDAGFTR